jgi:hypothetical protein
VILNTIRSYSCNDSLELGETPRQREQASSSGSNSDLYTDALVVPLVGLEEEAAVIRIYEAMAVPGLFQTMDYARTIIHSDRPDLSTDQIERWVDLRMARRDFIFSRDNPPSLGAVIDEAVLRRPVGGLELMRQQLRHLAESAALPTVTLRVLPFEAGVHPAMNGAFTIFTFREAVDPEVVYLEHTTNDLYLEAAEDVDRYTRAFDKIWNLALTPDDSIGFLGTLERNLSDRLAQI